VLKTSTISTLPHSESLFCLQQQQKNVIKTDEITGKHQKLSNNRKKNN